MKLIDPTTDVRPWLLLLHQLPPKPAYFRVRIWRRLQDLGAVAIKNSVYALPAGDETREDFEWLLREIVDGGGEACICEARMIDGLSDQDIRAQFDEARDADYREIADEASARQTAEGLIADIEGRLLPAAEGKAMASPANANADLRGKTWVTRRGVH